MITKKGLTYLLCFMGYLLIVLKGVPVLYNGKMFHINLFPSGNSSDIYYEFVDYRRFALYLIIWPVFCFIGYKIVDEIKINRDNKNKETS
ncbi:hypothetical protein FAM09_25810 [Niastella caeni]|uniref:Uncharacterized protein n=1 Tax=Niastella caeni TaxID=2569763 RepID=A0A4S8HFD6_9BACT|nr:hypothetical protein [Niastella caeni]THU33565.1 hypothetical protein FAM09_25810 [Niastella caeni]